MQRWIQLITVISLLGALPGCTPENKESDLLFKFNLKAGTSDLNYSDIYSVQGMNLKFDLVKFYISRVALQDEDNNWIVYPDRYILVDAENSNLFSIGKLNPGNYKSVQFGFGVDSSRNTENGSLAIPSYDYDDSHPLSVTNQMYWSWNPGYVWMKLEGKLDLNGNSTFGDTGETFSIHTGLDPAYRVIIRNFIFTVGEEELTINFDADILKFFDNYDLTTAKRNAHPLTTSSSDYPYVIEIQDNAEEVFGDAH